MAPTPDLHADYHAAWHLRLATAKHDRQARTAARRAQAEALLPACVRLLRDKYGAQAVWLVGSLARGNFGLDSDIDLVASGLDGAALFRAGADLEALAGDIAVDLVPLESAMPRLLGDLAREGRRLDEQA